MNLLIALVFVVAASYSYTTPEQCEKMHELFTEQWLWNDADAYEQMPQECK